MTPLLKTRFQTSRHSARNSQKAFGAQDSIVHWKLVNSSRVHEFVCDADGRSKQSMNNLDPKQESKARLFKQKYFAAQATDELFQKSRNEVEEADRVRRLLARCI